MASSLLPWAACPHLCKGWMGSLEPEEPTFLPRACPEATSPFPLPGPGALAPLLCPLRGSQLETCALGSTACCLGHSCRKLQDPESWVLELNFPCLGDNKDSPNCMGRMSQVLDPGPLPCRPPHSWPCSATGPLEAGFLQRGLLDAKYGAHAARKQQRHDLNSGLGAQVFQR